MILLYLSPKSSPRHPRRSQAGQRKEAHICFCCRRLWGLSLLPALTWSSLLCNRMLTHFPLGCWKTNAPWGGGLMDLVSDSPVFPAWLSRSAAQRHPLCTLSCPPAPAAVVPAQEDFSCLGAAGVYGKRVGRGEGKLPQSGWEGRPSSGLRQDVGAAGNSGQLPKKPWQHQEASEARLRDCWGEESISLPGREWLVSSRRFISSTHIC